MDRFEFVEHKRQLISHCPECDTEIYEGDDVHFCDGEYFCCRDCVDSYTYKAMNVISGRVNKFGEIE